MLMLGNFGKEFAERATKNATHMAGQKAHRYVANTIYPGTQEEDPLDELLPEYLICVDNSVEITECENTGMLSGVGNAVSPEEVGAFLGGTAGGTIFYFVVPAPISMLGTLAFVFGNAIFGEISQSVGKYAGKQFKNSETKKDEIYDFSQENAETGQEDPLKGKDFKVSSIETFTIKDDYQPLPPKIEKLQAPYIVPVSKALVNQADMNQSLVSKLQKQGTLNMLLFDKKGQIQFIYYRGKIEGLGLKPEKPQRDKQALLAQLTRQLQPVTIEPTQYSSEEKDHLHTVLTLFSKVMNIDDDESKGDIEKLEESKSTKIVPDVK